MQQITAKLRDIILGCEPDTQIGSLTEIAEQLGVGIVTIQQSARILEHEGLLAVKRGPGGGYYGTRPDEAALERAIGTYMRVHGFGYREAFEMTALLDCDIVPTAAASNDTEFRNAIQTLADNLRKAATKDERIAVEVEFRDLLFKAVASPLMQLVLRVTTQFYAAQSTPTPLLGSDGIKFWKEGRLRIFEAILKQDDELARFEAERYRREIMRNLRSSDSAAE